VIAEARDQRLARVWSFGSAVIARRWRQRSGYSRPLEYQAARLGHRLQRFFRSAPQVHSRAVHSVTWAGDLVHDVPNIAAARMRYAVPQRGPWRRRSWKRRAGVIPFAPT